MAIVYDIKKDLRYIEGKEEGREEERKELLEKIEREKKEAIKKMLNKGLSYEQISEFLEVSIDFIKQVEQSI